MCKKEKGDTLKSLLFLFCLCSPSRNNHIPPWKPYEMHCVIEDLLQFALKSLKMHGRLVYWLPIIGDSIDNNVPEHSCFRLVAKSLQHFGKWGRWLITVEKIADFSENYVLRMPNNMPTRLELRNKIYGVTVS
jgi:tRNA G10  N-methylase Trm11